MIIISGYLYALFAAICNSTIGIISRIGFNNNLSYYQVAFFKSFVAFLIISFIALSSKNIRKQIFDLYSCKKQISILAFFGLFILSFFETRAFSLAPVGIVSFIVYSTGILTIIVSYFLLNEAITFRKILCILLVIFGASLIFDGCVTASTDAFIYALIGGSGYSLFLILCKKFKIDVNIGFLWWMTAFGSFYLYLPCLFNFETLYIDIKDLNYLSLLTIILLAVIPTLGGFYFTSKSLAKSEASKVQIIEMSDPLFAILFAFIFLGEMIGLRDMIGGMIILGSLMLVR